MSTWSERVGGSWVGLFIVALCACLKSNEGSAGSETHFLSSCKAKCPAPYSCSCGVCTLACTSDRVCSAQFAGATCSAEIEAEESSCHAAPRVCDVECRADVECSAFGDAFSCHEGHCRERAEGAQSSEGDPTELPRPIVPPQGDTMFKQLALGRSHACALRNDGRVYCWGDNFNGQLGVPPDPNQEERGTARTISRLSDVPIVKLYAGTSNSCSIDDNAQTDCWGQEFHGQLGTDGSYASSPGVRPQPLEGLEGIAEVSIGDVFTCARLENGEVRCWGLNQLGQLGDGTRTGRAGAASAGAASAIVMRGATQIASGDKHSCALNDAGQVWCWGGSFSDTELGPQASDLLSATQGRQVADAVKVDVGGSHACALQRTGRVRCWGDNSVGQLGDGSTRSSATPVPVLEIDDAVDIALAGTRSCALLSSGRVACWGYNFQSALGTGDGPRATPSLVLELDDAYALDVGEMAICALSRSRGILCWGINIQMQVGDGTSELRTKPVPVRIED